uniref:Uncharacterized protein n=1 Tax=Cacopsylla melanoneura TaxID=428564 RepID=A0A8D9F9H8_9HEMI
MVKPRRKTRSSDSNHRLRYVFLNDPQVLDVPQILLPGTSFCVTSQGSTITCSDYPRVATPCRSDNKIYIVSPNLILGNFKRRASSSTSLIWFPFGNDILNLVPFPVQLCTFILLLVELPRPPSVRHFHPVLECRLGQRFLVVHVG